MTLLHPMLAVLPWAIPVLFLLAVLGIVHCWRSSRSNGPSGRPLVDRWFWTASLLLLNPVVHFGYGVVCIARRGGHWLPRLILVVVVLHVLTIGAVWLSQPVVPQRGALYRAADPVVASARLQLSQLEHQYKAEVTSSTLRGPMQLPPQQEFVLVRVHQDQPIFWAIAHQLAQDFVRDHGYTEARVLADDQPIPAGSRVDMVVGLRGDLVVSGMIGMPKRIEGTLSVHAWTQQHPFINAYSQQQTVRISGSLSALIPGSVPELRFAEPISRDIGKHVVAGFSDQKNGSIAREPLPELLVPPVPSDIGPEPLLSVLETAPRSVVPIRALLARSALLIDLPPEAVKQREDLERHDPRQIPALGRVLDELERQGYEPRGAAIALDESGYGRWRRGQRHVMYQIQAPIASLSGVQQVGVQLLILDMLESEALGELVEHLMDHDPSSLRSVLPASSHMPAPVISRLVREYSDRLDLDDEGFLTLARNMDRTSLDPDAAEQLLGQAYLQSVLLMQHRRDANDPLDELAQLLQREPISHQQLPSPERLASWGVIIMDQSGSVNPDTGLLRSSTVQASIETDVQFGQARFVFVPLVDELVALRIAALPDNQMEFKRVITSSRFSSFGQNVSWPRRPGTSNLGSLNQWSAELVADEHGTPERLRVSR